MYYYILTYLIFQTLHCMLILYMLDVKKSILFQKTYLQFAKKKFLIRKKYLHVRWTYNFQLGPFMSSPVKSLQHMQVLVDLSWLITTVTPAVICFQTFPRAFYMSNFAKRRLWKPVCLNTVKAFDIIFLIANIMYNQNYEDNCCR